MENMQRRTFLGSVMVAGLAQAGTVTDELAAFSRSGLTPAEYKRRWVAAVHASGQKPVWVLEPTGELEPFLDWYPGDEWVSGWRVDAPGPQSADSTTRSFAYEGERRGFQVKLTA
jgi:hypothetical protein